MSSYKPPHNVTLGVYIMAKTPDGQIVGVPMAVEEVGEGGIGALIEKAVSNLATGGLTPLTEEEHNAWAREMAAREQAKQLAAVMRDHVKYNAIDPERVDAILAAHKGRPGGDA
jgi:hypothetical protein